MTRIAIIAVVLFIGTFGIVCSNAQAIASKPLDHEYYKPAIFEVSGNFMFSPPLRITDGLKWQLVVRLRDNQVLCDEGPILAQAVYTDKDADSVPTRFVFENVEGTPRQMAWTIVEAVLNVGWYGDVEKQEDRPTEWVRSGDYLVSQLLWLTDYEKVLEAHEFELTVPMKLLEEDFAQSDNRE